MTARQLRNGDAYSVVVLFTQTYPFAVGEEFLTVELDQLVKQFKTVLIVPVQYRSGMRQSRELPTGARTILPTGSISSASVVLKFMLRHPKISVESAFRALTLLPKLHRMITSYKFDIQAGAVITDISKKIQSSIGSAQRVLFYSYWLHLPARVALGLRDELADQTIVCVSRAHGFDLYHERARGGWLPHRERLIDGMRKIYAASPEGMRYLRDRYPHFRSKIQAAPLGTRPAKNPGNPDQSSRLILSCSYIVPLKRLELVIDGIAEAQRRGLAVKWHHIGVGDSAYTAKVQQYAQEHLAPGSFSFAGYMPNDQLRRWYDANPAMVFVHLSETEGGFAVAVQEALAQGLPVIATDVGGLQSLREAPNDLFDGVLPGDLSAHDFADRIAQLIAADTLTYGSWVQASIDYHTSTRNGEKLADSFVTELVELLSDTQRANREGESQLESE